MPTASGQQPHYQCCQSTRIETLGAACGINFTQRQREQLHFPVREAGLSIRSAMSEMQAAYVGSRAQTRDRCLAIRSSHRWEVDELGSHLQASIAAVESVLEEVNAVEVQELWTQARISKVLTRKRVDTGIEYD